MSKIDTKFGFYRGTKEKFEELEDFDAYSDSIVYITGDSDKNNSCIFARGTYFADLSDVSAIKGIQLGDAKYEIKEYISVKTDNSFLNVSFEDNNLRFTFDPKSINVVSGSAENSAILLGEYSGIKNEAVSPQTSAIGGGSHAGLKGYYYSEVSIDNKQIALSTTQPISITNSPGQLTPSYTIQHNYKIGDTLTIHFGNIFSMCNTIARVDGNVITMLEALPIQHTMFYNGVSNYRSQLDGKENPFEFTVWNTSVDNSDGFIVTGWNEGPVDYLGAAAFAEGINTYAVALGAHAEGIETIATGIGSHVDGVGTVAHNSSEHACGIFNQSYIGDSKKATLFSVGIGTSDTTRENAIEIKKNGDIYIGKSTTTLQVELAEAKRKLGEANTNIENLRKDVEALKTTLNKVLGLSFNSAFNSDFAVCLTNK